jgi:hypothetical protein
MPTNTRTFTDLDLNFTAHPVNKDVAIKYDEQAIKQSVRNYLLKILKDHSIVKLVAKFVVYYLSQSLKCLFQLLKEV